MSARAPIPPPPPTPPQKLPLGPHARHRPSPVDTLRAHQAPARAPAADRGRVLVVDDDPTVREVVCRYLRRASYQTHTAASGPEALRVAPQLNPALVILDLMLPGIDGLSVMHRLHRTGSRDLGVIILSARGADADRILGLRLGADDYLAKPFSPGELVARADAVLRRRGGHDQIAAVDAGSLRIDPGARRVTVDGQEVALTPREFDLLLFLASHPEQAFSRRQLIELVWGYSFCTDTSTVTVHISRLREKLEPNCNEPRYLQTVWGVGYRFHP